MANGICDVRYCQRPNKPLQSLNTALRVLTGKMLKTGTGGGESGFVSIKILYCAYNLWSPSLFSLESQVLFLGHLGVPLVFWQVFCGIVWIGLTDCISSLGLIIFHR